MQQVKSPRLLKEILNALGYNDPYYFKKTFINPLIKAGIIAMTVPDKPTSSNQKYVLTDKGVKLLSENVRWKSSEKTREKTREKIIQAVKENPVITTNGLAETLGITVKGVEWQIKDLKSRGIIRRVGPAKGGHWEIIE